MKKNISHRVCLAPMLDYTDRHFRYLLRLITKKTFLYSEMITTGAVLYGDKPYKLEFSSQEHPVALQLGGSVPDDLSKASLIAEQYGYDEINLNVGCPSPRVKSGQFGAVLMEQPELVADCMKAMIEAVDIPVSIKTRIGVDHNDNYEQLLKLVDTLIPVGVDTFIVHARKAWLDGLSPKENREVPPLKYEMVYQLKKDFPDYNFIINGGITSHEQIQKHLQLVDGVMIGREAYHNCYFMQQVDKLYYNQQAAELSRKQILIQYLDYMELQLSKGVPLAIMAKHTLGLFYACKGARLYRRMLSENIHKKETPLNFIEQAMSVIDDDE